MNSITFFLSFIPILTVILLGINFLFAPHNPYKEKCIPFECGFNSFLGQNRTQFNISFFLFGLLFLVFDLELVIALPGLINIYNILSYGVFFLFAFFGILTVGFAFEIGKNALHIHSKQYNNLQSSILNFKNIFSWSKLKIMQIKCLYQNYWKQFSFFKLLKGVILTKLLASICPLISAYLGYIDYCNVLVYTNYLICILIIICFIFNNYKLNYIITLTSNIVILSTTISFICYLCNSDFYLYDKLFLSILLNYTDDLQGFKCYLPDVDNIVFKPYNGVFKYDLQDLLRDNVPNLYNILFKPSNVNFTNFVKGLVKCYTPTLYDKMFELNKVITFIDYILGLFKYYIIDLDKLIYKSCEEFIKNLINCYQQYSEFKAIGTLYIKGGEFKSNDMLGHIKAKGSSSSSESSSYERSHSPAKPSIEGPVASYDPGNALNFTGGNGYLGSHEYENSPKNIPIGKTTEALIKHKAGYYDRFEKLSSQERANVNKNYGIYIGSKKITGGANAMGSKYIDENIIFCESKTKQIVDIFKSFKPVFPSEEAKPEVHILDKAIEYFPHEKDYIRKQYVIAHILIVVDDLVDIHEKSYIQVKYPNPQDTPPYAFKSLFYKRFSVKNFYDSKFRSLDKTKISKRRPVRPAIKDTSILKKYGVSRPNEDREKLRSFGFGQIIRKARYD